ncbi:glutamate--cysteine ligase [Amycolatopsis sp. Poz14]|uniref:carboxylate-amine ligase n=1 Tax=Amycolatopsis sp. Poz14 TaxID=1447705 RepID=UPI001EE964CE|nr:glutamate--cysteine ligase [Amycolatopsis sp. Poz14]MCG3755166.1 glutamate--cysteine ligase [Amycolatopsis sp. Poz14]
MDVPTLGVEEEFLLAAPDDGRPMPVAAEVLGKVGRLADGAAVHRELRATQVEHATGVCTTAAQLRDQLCRGRLALSRAATDAGCAILATGSPVGPLRSPAEPLPPDRYARIDAHYGDLAADYEACGCHVHVGVPDADTAVAVVNHLARWLPTLLALSANSPFDRGRDTGLHSWRMALQTRFPGSGLSPHARSHAEHSRLVDSLVECGALVDREQTFWLAWPSPRYPTVELRVADVPLTVDGALVQAVLSRALVATALADLERGIEAAPLDPQIGSAAVWAATRHGLTGALVDPVRERPLPAAEAVADLLRHAGPALRAAGDHDLAHRLVQAVLRDGTGSAAQRKAGPDGVVAMLTARTVPRVTSLQTGTRGQ